MERRGRLSAEALEEASRRGRGELVNVVQHENDVMSEAVVERVAQRARESVRVQQFVALSAAREARCHGHVRELRDARLDRGCDPAGKRREIRGVRCHRVPTALDVGCPLGEQRRLAESCVCRHRRQALRERLVEAPLERRTG